MISIDFKTKKKEILLPPFSWTREKKIFFPHLKEITIKDNTFCKRIFCLENKTGIELEFKPYTLHIQTNKLCSVLRRLLV
jgi:hypothetical protein